jgi:hypothetical protein
MPRASHVIRAERPADRMAVPFMMRNLSQHGARGLERSALFLSPMAQSYDGIAPHIHVIAFEGR